MRKLYRGYMYAIGASLLFSLSSPLSKILLDDVPPMTLSGYIYLSIIVVFNPIFFKNKEEGWTNLPQKEKNTGENPKNGIKILVMVISGGILAPIFLLYGLENIEVFTASLFLNFELIFTVLLATVILKEKVTKMGIFGILVVIFFLIANSIDYNFSKLDIIDFSSSILLIIGACFFWAIDNNISGRIEGLSSQKITFIKGFFGGSFNLLLAFFLGKSLAVPLVKIPLILFIGIFSYGFSINLFILGLRNIGVAKTSIIFSLNPFFSSILSVFIFENLISLLDWTTFGFVLLGVMLLLIDKHKHYHIHYSYIHEHEIIEDTHHKRDTIEILDKGNQTGNNVIKHKHKKLKHKHGHTHGEHHQHNHSDEDS